MILDRLTDLERQARGHLDGLPVEGTRFDRSLDLRYVGQSFEINTPIDAEGETLEPAEAVRERFHRLHALAYGHADPAEPVELVNVRLSAFGLTSKPALSLGGGWAAGRVTQRQAVGWLDAPTFDTPKARAEYPIWDRSTFGEGDAVEGPCILVDPNSTALVLPGWGGAVDQLGNVVLERTR